MRTIFTLALLLSITHCFAQTDTTTVRDTVWRRSGIYALNFSQTTLTNWAAGGLNSVSGNAIVSYAANYKYGRNAWDNMIDLGYGALMQGEDGKLIKSDDRMELTTKLGRKLSGDWYYSFLLNFKSQFAPGYNYPNDSVVISRFLAPGYLLGALGFDYKPKPYFSAFISPATVRLTIVNDKTLSDAAAFGVDSGETVETQVGAYAKVIFNKDLSTLTNLSTQFDVFSNYLEDPQNLVLSWQMLLMHKVGKFLSISVAAQIIYDDKVDIVGYNDDGTIAFVGPRTQFRETIGVGLSYKFNHVSVR